MKKIACALFVTLGLFACKKEVKMVDAPKTMADVDSAMAMYKCKTASDMNGYKMMMDNKMPADPAKGVLMPMAAGESVPCPAGVDPKDTTKCTADGKATEALRAENCMRLYQMRMDMMQASMPAK